jgi:hypothetical protein
MMMIEEEIWRKGLGEKRYEVWQVWGNKALMCTKV